MQIYGCIFLKKIEGHYGLFVLTLAPIEVKGPDLSFVNQIMIFVGGKFNTNFQFISMDHEIYQLSTTQKMEYIYDVRICM